jgi:hypothetical protein
VHNKVLDANAKGTILRRDTRKSQQGQVARSHWSFTENTAFESLGCMI